MLPFLDFTSANHCEIIFLPPYLGTGHAELVRNQSQFWQMLMGQTAFLGGREREAQGFP